MSQTFAAERRAAARPRNAYRRTGVAESADWIGLVEASYDLAANEAAWERRVLERASPLFADRLALALLLVRGSPTTFGVEHVEVLGPAEIRTQALAINASAPPAVVDILYRGGATLGSLSEQVDRFDSDGRRFVVAVRNDPTHADPRGLTPRERQVAEFVGLGQSTGHGAAHAGRPRRAARLPRAEVVHLPERDTRVAQRVRCKRKFGSAKPVRKGPRSSSMERSGPSGSDTTRAPEPSIWLVGSPPMGPPAGSRADCFPGRGKGPRGLTRGARARRADPDGLKLEVVYELRSNP